MKVAVILSGELRCFEDCYPSLVSNILDYNDCDVFLHMYSDDDTERAKELYEPRSTIVENKKDVTVDIDPICRVNKPSEIEPEGIFYQWRNINKAFGIVPNTYDCVLKTRYDVKYTNPIKLDMFNMNSLNVPIGGDWRGGLFDMMAFGSYDVMKKYCSLIDNINSFVKKGIPCHSELLNSYNMRETNIERFDYTVLLRRKFDRPHIEDRVFTLR